MAFTRKTTHVLEGLAQLVEQFRDAPNLGALLSAYMMQVQEIEDVLFDLIDLRLFLTAEGAQLDGIGAIVGESRSGNSDADYRELIQSRIFINQSEATAEELITIANQFLAGSPELRLTESRPAHFDLIVEDPITPIPAAWAPLTAYVLGDRRSSFGRVYTVTTAGTSADGSGSPPAATAGPYGTSPAITDGTVVWAYEGPGIGARLATHVLIAKGAGIRGIVHWEEYATPFAFDGDPEGAGFDVGGFAQAHDF